VVERLRSEKGFGLIELLMAMVMLNVGILALVAAFQSSAFALRRSGMVSTGSTLADQQMEIFRAVKWDAILLNTTSETTARTDSTYNCDAALGGCSSGTTQVVATCTALTGETGSPPARCNPSRTVLGPDRHRYRIDSYIVQQYPTDASSSRQVKLVTVVVRDANKTTKVLARETSTFDQSTGT
jgi:Tfp pilus assembly protein PilV